jgi:hypothetical protein
MQARLGCLNLLGVVEEIVDGLSQLKIAVDLESSKLARLLEWAAAPV